MAQDYLEQAVIHEQNGNTEMADLYVKAAADVVDAELSQIDFSELEVDNFIGG